MQFVNNWYGPTELPALPNNRTTLLSAAQFL
jgi:hypothetical protein